MNTPCSHKTDKQLLIANDIRDTFTNDAEFIYQEFDEWQKLLVIFSKLAKAHDDKFKQGLPEGSFKIYRGGTPNGFSWSLDKKIATWFATRFKPVGIEDDVHELTVTKDDVLWYNNERNEQEVVLLVADIK
tara:strand:- start:429 stop:821 length:393 start_codon:yes stop_codon:yes gene_type:complete